MDLANNFPNVLTSILYETVRIISRIGELGRLLEMLTTCAEQNYSSAMQHTLQYLGRTERYIVMRNSGKRGQIKKCYDVIWIGKASNGHKSHSIVLEIYGTAQMYVSCCCQIKTASSSFESKYMVMPNIASFVGWLRNGYEELNILTLQQFIL